MIALPRALDDWSEDLAIFPNDVVATLLPWLPRIASAIGPLHHHSTHGDGAPDGFGGLTRRGSYERLLLSEWAIAEEVPLEFMRRAAMSEHTFLELARRSPAASLHSVALFDAGPHQIGAPRIAHLASLVVLARRARRANVSFVWGVLQDRERRTFEHVDEQSVLNLLRLRSAHEATAEDVDDFRALVDPEDEGIDDIWIVGGARTAALVAKRTTNVVRVDESTEIGARSLALGVTRAKATHDRGFGPPAILELPEPRACVRLLRDPFEVRKPAPVRVTPALTGSGLVCAPNGRRLFLRTKAGVLALGFPQKPLESLAAPRHLGAQRGPIHAVGWQWKQFVALSVDESTAVLSRRSKRGQLIVQIDLESNDVDLIAPGHDAPLGVLISVGERLYWRTDGGDVLEINLAARTLQRIETNVVAAAPRGGRLWMVVADDGRTILRRADQPRTRTELAGGGTRGALAVAPVAPVVTWPLRFEAGAAFFAHDHAVIVVRDGDAYRPIGSSARWDATLTPTHVFDPITIPGDREVHGAFTPLRPRAFDIGLVTSSRDRRQLDVILRDGSWYEIWADALPFSSIGVHRHFVVLHNANEQILVIDAARARIIRSFSTARIGT